MPFLLLATFAGCKVPESTDTATADQQQEEGYQEPFALAVQQSPPQNIRSLQLHPRERPGRPPVVTLGTDEQLILSFDDLSPQSRQYRVQVTHRNRNWMQSTIPASAYLEGFSYTHIQQSEQSLTRDPSYRHVEYPFPNDKLKPKVSGNYLLEVYEYQGDRLLFSMPFFVTEDEGYLETRIETLFAQRQDSRPLHQLLSSFRYPGFVEFPQFDLSLSYVQNQFWGRMRAADFLSTAEPGHITGRLDREAAFLADEAFRLLDIRAFDADGRRITEYQPGTRPPTLILRRDVQNLDMDLNPPFSPTQHIGALVDDRSGRYARVRFSLEAGRSVSPSDELHIVGDFNNWMISNANKMRFDASEGLWKAEALIKQGTYAYKYVRVTQNTIDNLSLEQSFRPVRQQYLSFVYFKDPDQQFDRLLNTEQVSYR
ncbi:protein of unknown function [Fodinibius roseus]|uniref:Type 9 secretion system plug protein N-terminal domain-containing protein n=1 Tax=Fodinibius roseus TaxID=1194090 RepID=A0A1M4YES1_9BACT|nr:type IX secretion system plug protein domain-containing protein [Fodinibius roseus]SHF04235.1 protein of unknown function [Fodinibius roseus]